MRACSLRCSLTVCALECLVEDPTTGRHQPRNYLQSLEERVAMLETMLQRVSPEVAFDHFNPRRRISEPEPHELVAFNPSVSSSEDATLASSSVYCSNEKGRAVPLPTVERSAPPVMEEQDEANDLASEIALLCLNAAGREPHYFGPSSAL